MHDAQIGLEKGDSISISDAAQGLTVFVRVDQDGVLGIAINRNNSERDNLQIRYAQKSLVSVSSPEGEKVSLANTQSSATPKHGL